MAPPDPEHFERERIDADRRYNDALTEFDRVVVAVAAQRAADGDTLARLMSALVTFLQQITAFVETKDRALAADAARRFDALSPALDAIGEVRTQAGVLQRAVEMLKRTAGPRADATQQTAPGHQPSAVSHGDDYQYVGFEDAFRGDDAVIEERLRAYVPFFNGRSQVLDVGCGRGEMLSALMTAGVTARGIDLNAAMVGIACDRGLDATRADALGYLVGLPDASLGGLLATQVIEHFEPSYLMQFLGIAAQKLQPGSPIVLETINPACWLAFFSSYLRDFTHVRPVHPETLQYLLRANGFERVAIHYSAPVPEHMKMKTVDLPADVLASSDAPSTAMAQIAHAVNANAVILNNLLFSYLDYAAVGYRS
jgi:SAM-dependent methyltransferase